jgi:hypothetical protein
MAVRALSNGRVRIIHALWLSQHAYHAGIFQATQPVHGRDAA